MLGDHLARCLFSKSWQLRESALQQLQDVLQAPVSCSARQQGQTLSRAHKLCTLRWPIAECRMPSATQLDTTLQTSWAQVHHGAQETGPEVGCMQGVSGEVWKASLQAEQRGMRDKVANVVQAAFTALSVQCTLAPQRDPREAASVAELMTPVLLEKVTSAL